MSDDNTRLLIVLEAQNRKLAGQLVQTNKLIDRFAAQTERRFLAMNKKMEGSFGTLTTGIKGIIGAAFLQTARSLIDANTRITNSLKVTGLEGKELTDTYNALFASAQRNATPFESLTELYSRASLSAKELGVSQERLLKFTDSVAVALRVNGKSASESSGALLQLSQLLGSGTVRAEEFNSVQEGALPILQAVATGIKQASGSVAKLRTLVIQGKLSSKAFFDGYEAGSYILEDKVAGAAYTTEQSFENLKTSLIAAAGKFDRVTNSSADFAEFLGKLSTAITDLSNNDGLAKLLAFVNDFGNKEFAGSLRDIEAISNAVSKAIDFVNRQGDFAPAATSAEAVATALNDINDAAVGARDSSDLVAGAVKAIDDYFRSVEKLNGEGGPILITPEMEKQLAEIVGQMILGEKSADEAKTAIINLANANPNFSGVISDIYALVDALAAAAAGAVQVNTAIANPHGPVIHGGSHRPPSANTNTGGTVDINAPGYKPTGGTGKGGSGRSPAERYADTFDQKKRQLDDLKAETALRATLNPLVNDYGAALEKLHIQQELTNAAAKAGIDLSPAQKKAIEDLAEGYAQATEQAGQLEKAQDRAREKAELFADTAKSSLSGFISDLRQGKTAAEALGNALANIGDKLLDFALGSLFDTDKGNILGNIFGALGFAKGGIAKNGRSMPLPMMATGGVSRTPAIISEYGQPEAAVPLPDGRRIPVDLRAPKVTGGQNVHVTVGVAADSNGNLMPFVESVTTQKVAQASPAIVGASVSRANKTAPGAVAQYQSQRAGSDWRLR